jgi:hypothetical protein
MCLRLASPQHARAALLIIGAVLFPMQPVQALYPDTDGAGACQFANPFAGTGDCVQYTGGAWTEASASADCASLFSVPYAYQFNAGGICSVAAHAADCVEDLGTADEKVNLNNATDPAFCTTLQSICNGVLLGDYFPVAGSVCDSGPPPADCDDLEPEACAAMQSNEDVEVQTKSGFIDFTPLTAQRRESSLILFPGAAVLPQAYASLGQLLAREGIYTAILNGPDGSLVADVMNDPGNGGVIYWLVAGHSLGGVTAVKYILANPSQVAGLGLLGSFPDSIDDISGLDLDVVSVFGTNDLVTTPAEALAAYPLMPPGTPFVKIRGGNHAQFGYYGETGGDGDPGTSPANQQALTVAALRNLAARVESEPTSPADADVRAMLNAASSDQGASVSQLYASGFGPEGIPDSNLDVFRTASIDEFISSKPSTSPGVEPEIHVTQFLNQIGNPDDPGFPPIYDGEIQAKFLTQEKLETDLALVTPNPQGSCVDVNEENVDRTRSWLEEAGVLRASDRAQLDQWTWIYPPDVLFPTGPDFIADETAVVTVVIDDLAQTVSVQSPSFFATLDSSNGAAAGRHYCKVLGYERIYLVMRELIRKTP